MLKTRILTAAVLVPAVLAALFLLRPLAWGVVSLGIIAVAAHEWARLIGLAKSAQWLFVAATLCIGAAFLYPLAIGVVHDFPDALVLAACGIAALFWIVLAPPWVIARWPTQVRVPMAVLG